LEAKLSWLRNFNLFITYQILTKPVKYSRRWSSDDHTACSHAAGQHFLKGTSREEWQSVEVYYNLQPLSVALRDFIFSYGRRLLKLWFVGIKISLFRSRTECIETIDMIWYDMIWYDMIWYDMIWYDIFNCNWVATRWQ